MALLGKCNRQKSLQAWIGAVILLVAVSASGQYASSPPSPPAPAAPPSATIQVPGQQQYVPAPVLMMNTPSTPGFGSAGSASPTNPQMYILPPQQPSAGPQQNSDFSNAVIPAGTKLLLTLQRALDTRTTRTGDQVFLRSRFPIVVQGKVILHAGTYVQGTLQQIIKDHSPSRATLIQLQRTNLILKNGTVVPMQGMTTISVRAGQSVHSVIPQGTSLEATMPFNVIIPTAMNSPASNPQVSAPIPVYIPVFGPPSMSSSGSPSGNGAGNSAAAPAPYIK